jgi:APA family basic amino acid/polyamine antiporter
LYVFLMWIFYAAQTAAVIVLRIKEPQMVRPYRTWGYPVVPVVFIVGALALTLNSLIEAPLRSAFAFGVMSIGMIFYARWRSRRIGLSET